MADFLEEKLREINARLKELRPLADEHARLEAAAAALGSVPDAAASSAPRRRSGRPASGSRKSPASAGGRRGRPKGSGTRANEALALVKANPGITIPQIAEKMGIKQNYLYRVLPGLAEDGLITKDGRGWHPKQVA
jgi:CRP-like cAMP-binding protein